MLISKAGVMKFRTVDDIQSIITDSTEAFDEAYEAVTNRPKTVGKHGKLSLKIYDHSWKI